MKIRIVLLALIAALFLGAPGFAEEVRITSDRFVIEEDSTIATFSGDVVIVQGTLTVHADKVIVHYGDGGASDIDSLEAIGSVVIDTPSQHITGQRGDYDPDSRVMLVAGDVVVVNESGRVTGAKMRVDFNTNTTEFDTNGNGRVSGVFNP